MEETRIAPAEAVLLLEPYSAGKCLQAGLLALFASGRIELVPASSFFGQPTLVLCPPTAETLPAHLAAIEAALRAYDRGDRLMRNQLSHALYKSFGPGFARYVHDVLAPPLIARGLLEVRRSRILGFIPFTRYRPTADTDALRASLRRLKAALDDLPSLIRKDPEQALQLVRSAGALLILSTRAKRQIPRLRKLLASRGAAVHAVTPAPFEDNTIGWEVAIERDELALKLPVTELLDAIETVGDLGEDGGGG